MMQGKRQVIRDSIVIPFIGATVIAIFMELNTLKIGNISEYFESFVISFSFWVVLGNGNQFIVNEIDKRLTWLDAPIKRTIIGIMAMILFTVIASTIIFYLYVDLYMGFPYITIMKREALGEYVLTLGITFFISLWFHGRGFLLEWREAAMNVERLKTENIKSRFEFLRNQINPHFLFNSLNALSSLVYDDQKKAVDFIQKLSQVYRYVLDHQNDEVVSLKDELIFLQSFVFLNKIRFGENFQVHISGLDDLKADEAVPPVALQMLIENGIKHNEISKECKLKINISRVGDWIKVKNNLNPISAKKDESIGVGLKNISMRYAILTDKKVQIAETDDCFQVTLPILKFVS